MHEPLKKTKKKGFVSYAFSWEPEQSTVKCDISFRVWSVTTFQHNYTISDSWPYIYISVAASHT